MKSIVWRVALATFFLAAIAARPAMADKFVPLPDLGGKGETLKIRVVRYDGSTNGKMVVDVRNTGKSSTKFVAEGIYFVPGGDPEKAPQRLGAAGPFTVVGSKASPSSQQELILQPGETRQLQLDVFCIDSHRGSPSPSTSFSVAGKRMPKELRQTIATDAAKIIRRNQGDVEKSKSEIQSTTWQARDRKWIKLEGERKQEKAAPSAPSNGDVQQQRRLR
ncbi:MAG TPA: hypothetical protein VK698_23115 [Kofleriaceae bacterium]|nr:hypothetical protein [Kofleriaceae bacterium]